MTQTNETELFEREGTKQQKNLTLSRELCGALDELLPHRGQSDFAERVLWTALVDEYGKRSVLEAVETVQSDLEPHERLDRDDDEEPQPVTIRA